MKDIRTQVKRRFEVDTKDHAMQVLHANGLYRHLRFRRPDCSSYWFDIITWPGNLTINGDMGCYVFARIEDMFEFFRTDRDINPGYWQEKIRNEGARDSARKFSDSEFRRIVHEQVKQWTESRPLSREEYADLWYQINSEIFTYLGGDGNEAFHAANQFEWESENHRSPFSFHELWDYNYTRYTFHYLWNCYAILFAIRTYDQSAVLEAA